MVYSNKLENLDLYEEELHHSTKSFFSLLHLYMPLNFKSFSVSMPVDDSTK